MHLLFGLTFIFTGKNRNWAGINGIWHIFLISGNYLLFRQGIACHGKCKITFIIFLSSFVSAEDTNSWLAIPATIRQI
ncbi:hypothetical protein Gohar_001051, partial [Gossypium harknessii]|nr:hypothetical protein [Gossypium harknessii]